MNTTATGADRVRKSDDRQRANVDRATVNDEHHRPKRQRVAAEGGEAEVDPERPPEQPQSTATGTAAPGTPILPQHPDPDNDTDMKIDPVLRPQDPADDTMDRPNDPGSSSSSTPAPAGSSSSSTPAPGGAAPCEDVHLERRGDKIRVFTKDSGNVDMAAVGDNGVQECVTSAHIAIDEDVAALGGTGGREWVNSHRTAPGTTNKYQKKNGGNISGTFERQGNISETFDRRADMK